MTLTLAERARRRITWRLIPFLFFLYILAYLDRINISVAELALKRPVEDGGLGMSAKDVGFAAGTCFFVGYWILEIPSTLSVLRWGARKVFARILVLWGICAALAGFVGTDFARHMFDWMPRAQVDHGFFTGSDDILHAVFGQLVLWLGGSSPEQWTPFQNLADFFNQLPDRADYQLYFFRFMLGVFEGGFFPSVIVYLGLWFRAQDRARAFANFTIAIPIASVIGGPLSGSLLNVHWLGLPGWRWIFILQGILPVLAGVATWFVMPDTPEKSTWLPDDEREWLLNELALERQVQGPGGHWAWVPQMWVVLLLTFVYFCRNLANYGLTMSMPAILKSQSGLSDVWSSVLSALPYFLGTIAMLVVGWHSDRTKERIWHVAGPMILLGLGLWLSAWTDGMGMMPLCLMVFLVGPFINASLPSFWPLPRMFLGATAAASAIGFINMIGNLGGAVGPLIVGSAATRTGGYAEALSRLAPWSIAGAVVVIGLGYFRRRHPA